MASWYKIDVNAKLTVLGSSVSVRTAPQMGTVVGSLNAGTVVQATERALISGDPWFHISSGWISGNYVEGWVEDYNDNNGWWYVKQGYTYPAGVWKTIGGKEYCFGKDAYLFVYCYIKSADGTRYYWVDDKGIYMKEFTTSTPDRNTYRVVEDYAAENAYSGSGPEVDKIYARNGYLPHNQMEVNARYIWNYLRNRGWTKNAVCGMLGNMQAESTVSPGRWQGSEGNMKLGFGLTMWSPASKYFDWAAQMNLYPIDMDSQLERILYEVSSGTQFTAVPGYALTFSEFIKSTKSAYDLARVFLHCYEKAGTLDEDDKRGNFATEWYNTLA